MAVQQIQLAPKSPISGMCSVEAYCGVPNVRILIGAMHAKNRRSFDEVNKTETGADHN